MDIRHCVLWMPTLYHTDSFKVIKREAEGNISDNSLSHHVKVSLLDNDNIIIKNDIGITTLNFIENSKIGLFSYSFDNEELVKIGFTDNCLPNSVYHLIKEFYHTHEHHLADADSLLKPCTTTNRIYVNEKNNYALVYYLDIFKEKFILYSKKATELYEILICNSTKKNRKNLNIKAHKAIEQFCQNALGEFLYCNTLLNSKRIFVDGVEKDCSDQRKRILNIKNAVQNIKLVDSKNQTEFKFESARTARRISALSFIFTVFGVVFSLGGVYFTYKSFSTPKYVESIMDSQNQIKQDNTTFKKEFINLGNKINNISVKTKKGK